VYNATDAINKLPFKDGSLICKWIRSMGRMEKSRLPLLIAAPGANGNNIPRREAYPTIERSNNTINYDAAVASFPYGGTDGLNTRVWWDKP
jgi:hypothetical protein